MPEHTMSETASCFLHGKRNFIPSELVQNAYLIKHKIQCIVGIMINPWREYMNKNSQQQASTKGFIFVILAVLVWGVSFINTKVLLEEYPPVSIAFFRQFIALVPLSIMFIRRKAYFKLSIRTILHFAVASLFGIVLYFVFENTGLKFISASEASILVATIPIFTLLMDTVVNRQKLDFKTLCLVLGSWAGVYLVITGGNPVQVGSGSLKGSLMVFGAMVSWIVYTLISKRLSRQYDSLQMTFSQTLLSIPLFIPFIWQEKALWHMPSAVAAAHLLFLGIFCSAAAYVFFLHGIAVLGPGVASSYLNLIPLVTMAIGAVFLGDRLALLQLAGAALILVSLGLISYFRLQPVKKEKAPEPYPGANDEKAS